jgi:hypothetical protein
MKQAVGPTWTSPWHPTTATRHCSFVTALADPSETDVSIDDLWIQSDRGVTMRLRTDNPNVAIAPRGDEVTVLFGWEE